MIDWLLLLPLAALLNRIRGGGMSNFTDRLPGRALYYVSFFFGAFAFLLTHSWLFAIIIGLGFGIAMAPGWGLWFLFDDKDHSDDPRSKQWLNRFINWASNGNPFGAMFLRMALFVWPMYVALMVFGFISSFSMVLFMFGFCLLFASCYAIRAYFELHNQYAEFMVGALWWLQIGLFVI